MKLKNTMKPAQTGLPDRLRESVKLGFEGFSLCYQPLVYAQSGALCGCEALLRWRHPDFPQGVSPCEFIPILEKSGLILEVGNWVLASAIKQCAAWGKQMPGFQMNINVSSVQFEHPDFKFFLIETLTEYGVSPAMITLELTESGQIMDPAEMQHVFDFIRGQGVQIAFDDFGLGYASLSIFRVLSADELKIDRSFLDRISYDVTDQKIVAQIINLCHSMNMIVCVEGIETPEMEVIVNQLEPDLLQGFYYNQPMTAPDFERFYFGGQLAKADFPVVKAAPEHSQSMVYAPVRPTQPMSRCDMIDNAYAGIFQVGMDHDFTFLTCNEGYRRMLGYTAKEMAERFKNQALGFVHPEDMDYVNQEIRRQLSLGDTITIEFRVVKSDGTPIWILGTGNVVRSRHGGISLIVVIIDNDVIKRRNLETEQCYARCKNILNSLSAELPPSAPDAKWMATIKEESAANWGLHLSARYQAAVAQWGDILFEYDFQSGDLLYSDNFHTIFGRSCRTNVKTELSFVHEADREHITEALEIVHSGGQPQPVEIRIREKGGGFRWYCVMFTLPEQLCGIPVSAIGKISDIDAEKQARDELLLQSQRDSMTGLLNKGTIEQEIRKQLSAAQPEQQYALLLIDIDDFKKINDSLGHISGDRVLCEIAARMQTIFPRKALIGRAGGDEFLVFLSYADKRTEIIAAAERLIAQLGENTALAQAEYQVGVSVGIACYPDDGTRFYDLFRRADSALYRAKELGKNTCCMAAK